MKYLKTFEDNKKIEYEKGDYVYVYDNSGYYPVKITDISFRYSYGGSYFAKDVNNKLKYIGYSEIIKELEPEEIEKFKLEVDAKKYNL